MDCLTTDEDLMQKLTKYFISISKSSILDASKIMKDLKSQDVVIADPKDHIFNLGGKHAGNYILWAKDIPAPAGMPMDQAYVGSNDTLLNHIVASWDTVGTKQKCYDWSDLPTINEETVSALFGVVVSAIKDEHWQHVYENHISGRKTSMKHLDQLRSETLRKVGASGADVLADMLQEIRLSSEPARIIGYESGNSDLRTPPVYIRANQAPVRSQMKFTIDSHRIQINRPEDDEFWTGEVHDV